MADLSAPARRCLIIIRERPGRTTSSIAGYLGRGSSDGVGKYLDELLAAHLVTREQTKCRHKFGRASYAYFPVITDDLEV